MIEFGWRTSLSPSEGAELVAMLAEAAREDGEGGFPEVSMTDPVPAGTAHLLLWMSAGADDWHRSKASLPVLAAYLRVEPVGPGRAVAHYVVRPRLRSLGVTTLLLEQLGPLGGDGWLGPAVTDLRIRARGDHPAAARVARRFRQLGVREGGRRLALVAPLDGRYDERHHGGERYHQNVNRVETPVRLPADDREVLLAAELWRASGATEPPSDTDLLVLPAGTGPVGAVWFDLDAAEMTEYGAAGRIEGVAVDGSAAPPTAWVGLLCAALERMRERGRAAAVVTVPAGEHALVTSARLVGFEHRRTDVEYLLSA